MKKRIIVSICGASGVIYGIRLLKALLNEPIDIYLILSNAGKLVLQHEAEYDLGDFETFLKKNSIAFNPEARLQIFEENNFFAPPASGSFKHNGMVIVPCSMRTLGNIASGIADNLIHRGADVCLKEKRPLIIVPRETPLSSIHIKNMYKVCLAGATIIPPSPSFYSHPKTIDQVVDTVIARILDHLNISHNIIKQWGIENL